MGLGVGTHHPLSFSLSVSQTSRLVLKLSVGFTEGKRKRNHPHPYWMNE